jgi:nucleoside-diphosphate-sugar epimerase
MPRILIAGCGYVGAATAELFHANGWDVEGWTSSAESARELQHKPFKVRAVDITDEESIAREAAEFDAVMQCVSSRGGGADEYRRIYLQGAANLAATFPRALLLFTSSTSVYAQRDGEWVTEMSPAEPDREAGRVLRETEELVLARGGIVARLAGVYGPGRSALLRKFLAGNAVIEGRGTRFINQAHREDIAAALVLLVEQHLARPPFPAAPERIFNVADNHPWTEHDCYAWLARQFDRALPPTSSAPGERKRGNTNKRVGAEKLLGLGWSPRFPEFATAMTESIIPKLDELGA